MQLRLMVWVLILGVAGAPALGGEREHAEREHREREHKEREHEAREHREHEEREHHERRERVSEPEVLGFIEEHMPHVMAELRELRRENPKAFHRELKELTARVHHMREMKEHAPEIAEALLRSYKLEHQCHELSERIRETDDREKREGLTAELREKLNQVFELRLREPELEILHLQREIDELKSVVEKRQKNRERIVERRLRDLVGEVDEGLEWW